VNKKAYQKPLEQRVLQFIRDNNLLLNQRHLLVAVSGGPDSICMLHILFRLKEELNLKLHVAHLDHKLRGDDSRADADYVSRLTHQLGLPSTIETRDVKSYRNSHRVSPEEAAREVRYTFLAETAESISTDRVAVGHTSDDQVETVLMHLIRGTGTRGLRGLQPNSLWKSSKNSVTVIRPLLPVSRQETTGYCQQHRLEPRFDASNLSLSALRNKIRHQLIPLLESYNPAINKALLRTARFVGDDLDYLNQGITLLKEGIVKKKGETIWLDKERFLELPLGLQRHLLREAVEELVGSLRDIEAHHIEEMISTVGKQAGKSINLPGDLVFVVEYDRCLLTREEISLSPFPLIEGAVTLQVPGETNLSGWRVMATIIKREQMEENDNDFTAYLSFDEAGENLTVCSWQPGDRFQPLGMSRSKKLGEFMIDEKIPRAWRRNVPVVCSPKHILWVVGWRIDDRVKVTESTRQILRLGFERR